MKKDTEDMMEDLLKLIQHKALEELFEWSDHIFLSHRGLITLETDAPMGYKVLSKRTLNDLTESCIRIAEESDTKEEMESELKGLLKIFSKCSKMLEAALKRSADKK